MKKIRLHSASYCFAVTEVQQVPEQSSSNARLWGEYTPRDVLWDLFYLTADYVQIH